ncbi:similar to Naumovozyma dairenensis NDAI_0G00360 hypothetical protein [Maudiozyma saulgeensis]|uniref:Uncharacterized protein n=1 Tax=Maudiozyma saulgeensis TaxID=1789683 RepID=A0A1X7RAC1_9SACH|nr:similar to Naumovozyma dairenensis NDAI_0G00360 hypothetical protein [Kazachstania saulgeensis]
MNLKLWTLFFSKKSRVTILLLCLVTLIFTSVIWMRAADENHFLVTSYYPFLPNGNCVQRKEDLLHASIKNLGPAGKRDKGPLDLRISSQNFTSTNFTGFVSNLSIEKLKAKKDLQREKLKHSNIGGNIANSYDQQVSCQDLSYTAPLEHLQNTKILEDDLLSVRRHLIRKSNKLSSDVQDKSRDEARKEEDIVEEDWFRFGGSAVWLETEQCYLVFTRIVYSRKKRKNHPHVSLIRAQAFDKNWKEIVSKSIPYLDTIQPKNLASELTKVDKELNFESCELYGVNSPDYDRCIVQQARNKLKMENAKENILSRYFITYPTVLEIPFTPGADYRGPEDPHVILRTTDNSEEPVIVFNMDEPGMGGRKIYSFMPHRRVDPLLQFSLSEHHLKSVEKNWTPFFHPYSPAQSTLSRGFIYFIYAFSPLEILKCSLNDGTCAVVFDGETVELDSSASFKGMRGGTQFIPLPSSLPAVKGKNIWIGFPKLHITDCGCAHRFYRPMLDVLIESNGVYHQELIVPSLDFGIEVLSWDLVSTDCGTDTNILSPNSVAYWDVVGQDDVTKKFEDYMVLSVSEADTLTRIITVRGILNYILGIYRDKEMEDTFSVSSNSRDIIKKTLTCVVHDAKEQCKIYGQFHKGLEKKE